MNDSTDDDERSLAMSCEGINIAYLGNVKVETKQYHPIQYVQDSTLQYGLLVELVNVCTAD